MAAAAAAAAAAYPVGSEVLVQFAVPGELWHERVILAHVSDAKYVTLTPGFDLYQEDYASDDISAVRTFRPGRQLPHGIAAGN
eukprot:6172422-Karenia_brevis.AAC.1